MTPLQALDAADNQGITVEVAIKSSIGYGSIAALHYYFTDDNKCLQILNKADEQNTTPEYIISENVADGILAPWPKV